MEGIQPRYVAYCVSRGINTADAMLALDRVRWPGGANCGYICWISSRWAEWRKLFRKPARITSNQDHEDFTEWLFEQVSIG